MIIVALIVVLGNRNTIKAYKDIIIYKGILYSTLVSLVSYVHHSSGRNRMILVISDGHRDTTVGTI